MKYILLLVMLSGCATTSALPVYGTLYDAFTAKAEPNCTDPEKSLTAECDSDINQPLVSE